MSVVLAGCRLRSVAIARPDADAGPQPPVQIPVRPVRPLPLFPSPAPCPGPAAHREPRNARPVSEPEDRPATPGTPGTNEEGSVKKRVPNPRLRPV